MVASLASKEVKEISSQTAWSKKEINNNRNNSELKLKLDTGNKRREMDCYQGIG
jgi:hypothetical protein